MVRVLYQFQESKKGTPDGGEARLVVTPDFIAVIDGATSKSGETFNKKTGGLLAAEAVADAIRTLPRAITAFKAVARLTQAVNDQVINRYVPHVNAPDYHGDRPNASVVMYSVAKHQIWRIGDGPFKTGPRMNYGRKSIDTVNSKMRADYIHALLDRGEATVQSLMEKDLGREFIMPRLISQPLLMNNEKDEMGYGVIDGRTVPWSFIEVHDAKKADSILLASDGFLGTLRSSSNFATMNSELETQLAYYQRDPLMIEEHQSTKGLAKGNKWHDDITIVEFRP